ncbi:hypothetical protein BH11BAC7_BH11BAC7_15220 [soil metagenome]
MKNIQNIVFLFLLAFVFCTCRRPRPEPIYTPLNPEFKAWCSYKPGSWWTYKELASTNRDSMWVSYYSEEKDDGPDGFYYYKLVIHISSANDSFGTHWYYGEPSHTDHSQLALVENYSFGQGTMSEGRFYFSINSPLVLPPGFTFTQLDSFVLSSSFDTYYNVTKITRQLPEYGNWIKTEYYARNIGVIRREMFNGEIWEVENFNIVQ